MASRSFQISQLMNYVIELVPDNLNLTEEISRIIGFSAVTSVNLDPIPKSISKGDKIRFEGFAALGEILKRNKFSDEYISTLKTIHDTIEKLFSDLIQINYTPNFITFACKFPKGRSKTFLFVRFKKNGVQLEFSAQTIPIKTSLEFTNDITEKLKLAFNNLSEKQIS